MHKIKVLDCSSTGDLLEIILLFLFFFRDVLDVSLLFSNKVVGIPNRGVLFQKMCELFYSFILYEHSESPVISVCNVLFTIMMLDVTQIVLRTHHNNIAQPSPFGIATKC
jgi:hypothetical protein